MKTIELNGNAALVLALIIAGIGSLLPSFFNLAGYVSGMVYVIVAIVLLTTYKRKMWWRFSNIEMNPAATAKREDTEVQIKKLRDMNQGSGL